MNLGKICFGLLIVLCCTRQFIDSDIVGTRDLDTQTYENSFKRVLTQQTKQNTKVQTKHQAPAQHDKKVDSKSAQNTSKQSAVTKQDNNTTHQSKADEKFDQIDYAGDITASLKSLLSPQSGIDQDLLKKLMQNTGITQKQQLAQQYEAAKTQQKIAAEQSKQFQQKMSDWVKQEKQRSDATYKKVQNQQIILQGFSFYMKSGTSKKLYMVVPPGRPQNYLFHINLYWHIEDNFVIPRSPSQTQTVNLTISHKNKIVNQSKTYVSHFFEWYQYHQNGNIELKFDNLVGQNIVVLVNLQRLKTIADTIKDEKIDPLVSKLKNIIEADKLRHMTNVFKSKSQIGYKNNQQSLVAELLIFTGLQSVAVLVVMMVQLYYLQKLINNNNIMV